MKPSTSSATEVSAERLLAAARLAGSGQDASGRTGGGGGVSGPRRGQGTDVYDVRAYQEGDDPRLIDPATTARSGRPHVRTFHEEVERTLHLVADFRPPMLWGTRGRLRSVAAAEALAVEGWRTVAAGGRVGLRVVGGEADVQLRPQPRRGAMMDIAAALATAHGEAMRKGRSHACPPLSAVLEHVGAEARPGAGIVLATGLDVPGDEFAAVAEAVGRRCRLTVLLVQDAVQIAPPGGIFLYRSGAGRGGHGRFRASSAAGELEGSGLDVRIVDARLDLLGQENQ